MRRELNGENRRIDDPDVLQAVYPQLGIDNTSLVTGQHREGVRGMELGSETVGDEFVDRIVRSDSRARTDFVTEDILQRRSSCDLPGELDGLPHQLHVGPMGQVLRIEGGVVEGIVGGDVQTSLTVWVLKGDLNGYRLAVGPRVPGGIQQYLGLADTTEEEVLGVSLVESLETLDDTWVLAGSIVGHGAVEVTENLLLERGSIGVGTDKIRKVGVARCRVDKGKEGSIISALGQHRCHGIRSSLEGDARTLEGRVSACAITRGKSAHGVILQVLTDTGKIQGDVDASGSQDVLWSNTAVHQKMGASYRAGSQQNLLLSIDGGNGTTPGLGELDTGGSEVAVENDLGNGGVGQDVEVRARRQRVNVCGTRVGTSPVSGIDGRSGNESPERLATRGIGALRNSDILESGYPITHNREDAKNGIGGAVSATCMDLGVKRRLTIPGNSHARDHCFRGCLGCTRD